ncbi:hypothetical protein HPB52_021397 [Rhipicephalus sanguineus]|uniref:Tick transposon n=1 Tax=Rhipicephalus sanguineus TaxID=34632 RepID=A0A9D4PK89_RHISA|nr:hypothetical protein HPB52_021397 [Rhipicephalus sanguineus]
MLDSRLAHLIEARNSLRRHWKRQRHNRKLRKRIAQLNGDIEHHSAVLCRQQWHAVCQEADGQLHKGKTWRLLRHLLDDQTTKGAQHYMLNKTIHKAVKEMGEAEVQRRLDAKYLPVTPTDPLPSYEGATNERLGADIEEWEVRATRTGRTILQRIGINAPATTPEEAKQLPRDVLQRLRVPPLPKHMHPQVHRERRMARATALTKGHANDPRAYYVDVAKYPHQPNTYAAAVIAADTGVLTASGSIRCKSPTEAEEFAIALALAIPDCRTVLSDSKPAIVNLATKNRPWNHCKSMFNDSKTGNQRYREVLDAGPNRNEEADTEAHALTSRGSPSTHSSEPQRPDAEDEDGTERADASNHRLTETYNAAKQPHYGSCKYKPYGPPSGQSTFARRHHLWDCAPPPGNQEEAMPTAISSKIISREPGKQRDVVQHVLSILERQRPKAAPPQV